MFSKILPAKGVKPAYQRNNISEADAKEIAKDHEVLKMEPVLKSKPRSGAI